MGTFQQRFPLIQVLKREFAGYSVPALQMDILAGITVAAVALPLALAFGIASGATPAAGLVTAIVAGFLIGGLGGAGFQISGPTGAMSAVLIVLANRYGLESIWMAGAIAGIIILLLGIFDLGKIVNFIPTPVIAGFTSGIAVIIFIGQIDNLLGVTTEAAENALVKLGHYLRFDYTPNPAAVGISLLTILLILLWSPQRFERLARAGNGRGWALGLAAVSRRVPGALLALVVTTMVAMALGLNVSVIGTIPQSVILNERLTLAGIPWDNVGHLIVPALSIAALGAIESLLSGVVAGRMPEVKVKMTPNQELIAQGLGNIVIPFFGGVPATAAIARTSVAIKSGGRTRIVSLTHAAVLLVVALFLAPILSRVPMATLAGILAVTTWRMNAWTDITAIFGERRDYAHLLTDFAAFRAQFRRRFKHGMLTFLITMAATVALDLTQAIIIGIGLSAIIFVFQISNARVVLEVVDPNKIHPRGVTLFSPPERILVAYVVGPLFFGTANAFKAALDRRPAHVRDVILSLRTMPLIDITGINTIKELIEEVHAAGGQVHLAGLNAPVEAYLRRDGVLDALGADHLHWSAFEAIVAVDAFRTQRMELTTPSPAI